MGLRVSDLAIMRRLARQKWGNINSQKKIVDGVYWFSCVSHGGYVVDIEEYPEIEDFKEIVETRKGSGEYYKCEQRFAVMEEDCDWSVLEWLYPDVMDKAYNKLASDSLNYDDYRNKVKENVEKWNKEYLDRNKINS